MAERKYPDFEAPNKSERDAFIKRKALERLPLVNLGESIVKQTDFSLSLAKHVISTKANDNNFVFSPLSMHVLLSMAAAGSAGPTRAQFLGYLKSKSVEELNSLSSQVSTLLFADGGPLGGPRLSFANGVWVDQSLATLKPAFKEIVDKDNKAIVGFFDKSDDHFIEKVNGWAKNETNGLINDLLPPGSLDSNTSLILANALYFKGSWVDKFDVFRTKHDDFFLLNGTKVRVPFMSSTERQFVRAFRGFKVLRLPYAKGDDIRRFSMYIYLPDESDGLTALVGFIQNYIPGLPALVKKFGELVPRFIQNQNQNQPGPGLQALLKKFGSFPGFIQNHLPTRSMKVRDFRVPKFKINYDFEASGVLQGHGLVLPFWPGGMTEMVEKGGEHLYISSFFHKSCIEVDEKGTEAAAASACIDHVLCSLGDPPPFKEEEVDFVADHPFLFVVREDVSGGVLFVGQVVNPGAA